MAAGLALTAVCVGCGERQSEAENAPSETAAAPIAAASPSPTPASSPSTARSPAPSAAVKVPERLDALGTEPFWNVRIRGSKLRYATPDDQAGTEFNATREDTATSSTFSGILAGKPFELAIVPERCSDGMSDTVYPYSAWLRYDGQRNQGCARDVP